MRAAEGRRQSRLRAFAGIRARKLTPGVGQRPSPVERPQNLSAAWDDKRGIARDEIKLDVRAARLLTARKEEAAKNARLRRPNGEAVAAAIHSISAGVSDDCRSTTG